METEKIPKQWKVAKIILLYKNRDRGEIKNYRSISLTFNLGKVFMKTLEDMLYLQFDQIQAKEQSGFRRDHSTIDQIFIIKRFTRWQEKLTRKCQLGKKIKIFMKPQKINNK